VLIYFFTFLLAFSLSWYVTPVFQKAALTHGIVDQPDGKLKKQREPVAYLGGLAIYLSFLLTLAFTFRFSQEVLGILLAGTIIVILGLIDDFKALSPGIKFLGQFIAVFVLIKAGIHIKLIFIPYPVCIVFSFLWLIAVTNAFNIIDVMDGLSAGVAFFCSLVFFIVASLNGHVMIATLTIALAGSLAGFLRYNFAPATIYLGDTGSLFIGLILGALSMIGSYTEKNSFGFIAPVIILGIPIFDTLFVMYVRWLRGIPVIVGSPDHFALRLRKWRFSTRQTVMVSYFASIVLGIASLLIIEATPAQSVLIVLFLTCCALIVGYYLKKIDMTL
jgi:UDP-GlcNAc:undecaprenyl-phosphate GlcNAc-1-phosphate transferase